MAEQHAELSTDLQTFINQQQIYFVGTGGVEGFDLSQISH